MRSSSPPAGAFDELVHAPQLLWICPFLDATSSTEFATLREALDVADSVLSKHLEVLQEAGYVSLAKPSGPGRVRTRVELTPAGRAAYAGHVAALRALVDSGAGRSVPTTAPRRREAGTASP